MSVSKKEKKKRKKKAFTSVDANEVKDRMNCKTRLHKFRLPQPHKKVTLFDLLTSKL